MQLWQQSFKIQKNSLARENWCCKNAENNAANIEAKKNVILICKAETYSENSAEKTDIINDDIINKWRQKLAVHDIKMFEKC